MVSWAGESEAERLARYAAKDVTDKLDIKPGYRVRAVGTRDAELLARVRAKTGRRLVGASVKANVILYWPESALEVTERLSALKEAIEQDGAIWVISAKKGGAPYLPDRELIPFGLAAGLVDNKICSISEAQTAMRFVIRVKDRR